MSLPLASSDADMVLNAWRGNKPAIGVMGEFSSGKSTLLNFMLDRDLAQTQVTATPLPPVWFTHSTAAFAHGLRADGMLDEIDLSDPSIDFRAHYLAIHRGIDAPVLTGCDIIDCPGLSDPELNKDHLQFLQPYFDFAIWCTPASQAWRQTDKAAYEKLAEATRENSILVVTRMDKLRNDKDRAKVLKRVQAETADLFGTVLGLQTPKAAAVPAADRSDAAEGAWVKTGGFAFEVAVSEAILASSRESGPAASPAKRAEIAAVETPELVPTSSARQTLIDTLILWKKRPTNTPYFAELDHLIAAISGNDKTYNWDDPVLHACSRIEGDDLDTEKVISQLKAELRAFGRSDRLRLDR